MQEVFEKIKQKLEENKKTATNCSTIFDTQEYVRLDRAIEIVDQVAEEINQSLANNNQSLTNDCWIPCSERLPEESGEYITFVKYSNKTFISIDEIDCDGILKEWNCTPDYRVIAWQPLPAPPKKEV